VGNLVPTEVGLYVNEVYREAGRWWVTEREIEWWRDTEYG